MISVLFIKKIYFYHAKFRFYLRRKFFYKNVLGSKTILVLILQGTLYIKYETFTLWNLQNTNNSYYETCWMWTIHTMINIEYSFGEIHKHCNGNFVPTDLYVLSFRNTEKQFYKCLSVSMYLYVYILFAQLKMYLGVHRIAQNISWMFLALTSRSQLNLEIFRQMRPLQ